MTALRRLGSVLFCAWIGAWIARAAFVWVLDVPRTWVVVALVAGAASGGVLALAAAIEKEGEAVAPAPQRGPRDSALGAMALIGGTGAAACCFVWWFPWGLAAAVVLLGFAAATVYWWSTDR